MQKKLLSVGMPSNRPFHTSDIALRSAVDFCVQAGAQLVVSDNSQDEKKAAEIGGLMQNKGLDYIKSPPCSMMDNWFQSFNATSGEFVLMMGDDDRIFRFAEAPVFQNLPKDVTGIKPCVFAYADVTGLLKMNASPILGNTAPDRMSENLQTSSGTNIGIFSFWRRDVFKSLMELWYLHHPTKGTYSDWAIMNGLVSSGKIILDPTTCYYYNLQNWAGDAAAIAAQTDRAFVTSGLPAGSGAYLSLLNAIDSYIFVSRKDTPLPERERDLSAVFIFDLYLKDYIKNMPQNSLHENAKEILNLSKKLAGNDDIASIFTVLSDILGQIRPGLDQQYKDFHTYARGKAWGVI